MGKSSHTEEEVGGQDCHILDNDDDDSGKEVWWWLHECSQVEESRR